MKYIYLFGIFLLLTVTGCTKKEELPKEAKQYQKLVQQLKSEKIESQELPCHLEVHLESSKDNELMYTVVLDEPKEEMYQITALFMHDDESDSAYPSIGIFDDKLNLVPGVVDKEKSMVKGIVLSGYIKTSKKPKNYHGTFRLYLDYETKDKEKKTIFYEKQI